MTEQERVNARFDVLMARMARVSRAFKIIDVINTQGGYTQEEYKRKKYLLKRKARYNVKQMLNILDDWKRLNPE